MANNQEILNAVDSYLVEEAHHAILLDGEWGCGKSRFIESVLRPHLIDGGWDLVHASLYGVSSTSELYERIIGAILRGGAGELDGKAGRGGMNVARSLLGTAGSFIESKTGLDVTLSANLAASFIQWDDKLLVLDDLERRAAGFTDELFGVVNDLVENRGARVLFVCNVSHDDISIQAFEKLIWYRIRFEPPVNELVHDILGESLSAYPEDIRAERLMVAAAQRISCSNARAFLKVRQLVDLICASGFPQATWIDASRRRQTLSDVFRYALCGALMTGPSLELEKPSNLPEISLSDVGITSDEVDFESMVRWTTQKREREEYLELRFLDAYYENGTFDSNQAFYILEDYVDSRYPDSDVRAAAMRAEYAVRMEPLEDDEAKHALRALLSALSLQDLAIETVPRMLAAIERLAHWGIADEYDAESALEDAKRLAEMNPEEARKTELYMMPIVHGVPIFDWQRDYHIVDDYLDHLHAMEPPSCNERLATAIENCDESSAALAAEIISGILEDGTSKMDDALLPPELLGGAFAISEMEALSSLRGAIHKLNKRLSCSMGAVPQLLEWLRLLKEQLEGISIDSTMRNYCRLLTIHDIDVDIEELERLWDVTS